MILSGGEDVKGGRDTVSEEVCAAVYEYSKKSNVKRIKRLFAAKKQGISALL